MKISSSLYRPKGRQASYRPSDLCFDRLIAVVATTRWWFTDNLTGPCSCLQTFATTPSPFPASSQIVVSVFSRPLTVLLCIQSAALLVFSKITLSNQTRDFETAALETVEVPRLSLSLPLFSSLPPCSPLSIPSEYQRVIDFPKIAQVEWTLEKIEFPLRCELPSRSARVHNEM